MTFGGEKDISSIYRKLQQQADRTGLVCCRDITIRNRLIQLITDMDIREEIALMKEPSAEDVLQKYQEIEKVPNWGVKLKSLPPNNPLHFPGSTLVASHLPSRVPL